MEEEKKQEAEKKEEILKSVDSSSEKEKEREAGKKSFRAHTSFRQKKQQSFFKKGQSKKKDPFLQIVEQHQRHKMRIAGIIMIILAVMAVFFFSMHAFKTWQKEKSRLEKVDDISKRLQMFDSKINETSDYPKYKMVVDAVREVERANLIDPKNSLKWAGLKEKYLKILDEVKIASGSNFIIPSAVVDMVYIPQGRFFMGRRSKEPGGGHDEFPRHAVLINYEFWISRTEVTNAQFREFFPAYRMETWRMYKLDNPSQPVAGINWHLASSYCGMLTQQEKEAGRLPEDYEYRLPTEAEWEYACRSGTETYYYWGDAFSETGAQFANTLDFRSGNFLGWKMEKGAAPYDGHIVSAPAGSYKPNAFGIYDMSGNVWEWCWDWYNPSAYKELFYIAPVQIKPVVSRLEKRGDFERIYYVDSTSKVLRGGSWGNLPSDCRSAARDSASPETKNIGIGFRIALAPKILLISPEPEDKEE